MVSARRMCRTVEGEDEEGGGGRVGGSEVDGDVDELLMPLIFVGSTNSSSRNGSGDGVGVGEDMGGPVESPGYKIEGCWYGFPARIFRAI